ncbi:unnamed protein product [Rhizoctonia solani]|uniref:Fungal-specific transcription factor domain protein n=1 Tax=Rhizoctonia solani TaxID=456999 RepID=A0A8H3GVJ2_9AGAM|nr:unnamed protein product [Rhizoctonia solani]
MPSISRDSAILDGPVVSETWTNGIYPDFIANPMAPWNPVGPLTLLPLPPHLPRQLPSRNIGNFSQSSGNVAQVLVRVPHSYDMTAITSGSKREALAWPNYTSLDEKIDLEDPRLPLLVAPTLDKNVKENALPFVIQCYSQWAIFRLFEPLKAIHAMENQLIKQFSLKDTRTRTILLANVMRMYTKNLEIDGTGVSILNYLSNEVEKSVKLFMATRPSSPVIDKQNAIHALDTTLELFAIQVNSHPLATCFQLLDRVAHVFRRACPQPPGHALNLLDILMDPNPNLRHFAIIDIMGSVAVGRPSCFRYEVPLSFDLCGYINQLQNTHSLRWLHGMPEEIVLLFAWINHLCETPGVSDNPELIPSIEKLILQIRMTNDGSDEPILMLGRVVVQECWRSAVFIYLYMVLGKANALDPRVIRAQKGFMQLIRGVKPGRRPDVHLLGPIVVAGVATLEEEDRSTLRQRILGIRECTVPGTTGNEALLELEDIWTRTKNERRAAIWLDLRISHMRITQLWS